MLGLLPLLAPKICGESTHRRGARGAVLSGFTSPRAFPEGTPTSARRSRRRRECGNGDVPAGGRGGGTRVATSTGTTSIANVQATTAGGYCRHGLLQWLRSLLLLLLPPLPLLLLRIFDWLLRRHEAHHGEIKERRQRYTPSGGVPRASHSLRIPRHLHEARSVVVHRAQGGGIYTGRGGGARKGSGPRRALTP